MQPLLQLVLRRRQWQGYALVLVLLAYLIPQVALIDKPGLQEDEAMFLVPSMELAHGMPITVGYSADIFGVRYPTLMGAYTGNSLTVPVALMVRMFGYNAAAIRLLWILVGAATILFTFLVSRELLSGELALLAALLLAVNPTFWLFSHVGAFASVSMDLDVMASLYFFLYFYRTRKWPALAAAAFFTGHGLYSKLAFGYFLVAYVAIFVYLWLQGKVDRRVVSLHNISIALPAFLVGIWPLFYNIVQNRATLITLRNTFFGTQQTGTSNLDFAGNLMTRLQQTHELFLQGRAPAFQMAATSDVPYNAVLPFVFYAICLLLFANLVWPGARHYRKECIAFPLLVFVLYQLLSIFTPSTLNYGIYAFIPPFSAMILALGCFLVYDSVRTRSSRAIWFAVAGAAVLVASETGTLSAQYDLMARTGGRGVWSSTITQLNDYLLKQPDKKTVSLDWGLDCPIYVLSDLRISPVSMHAAFTVEQGALRLWADSPPPNYAVLLEPFVYQAGVLFLARNETNAGFKQRLSTLDQLVTEKGGQLTLVHRIYEPDGAESIQVYEVQWPSGHPSFTTVDALSPVDPLRQRYPQITTLTPDRTMVGVRPNQQPNGQAAISISGRNFDISSVVYFGSDPLPTAFGNAEWVTATIPDRHLGTPTTIDVSVVNQGGLKSNIMKFRVLER